MADERVIKAAVKLLKSNGYVITPPFIGKCALPECEKEFLVKKDGKSGRPKSRYCCGKHRQLHHDRTAAERVRQYRARKKITAILQRWAVS